MHQVDFTPDHWVEAIKKKPIETVSLSFKERPYAGVNIRFPACCVSADVLQQALKAVQRMKNESDANANKTIS